MNTVFIYALNDPETSQTRYVGKARDPYERYEKHLRRLREENHKACWLRSLVGRGKTPILEILDEVLENEWPFWEKEWIRLYRLLLVPLTNLTEGGEGNEGLVFSETSRAKMRASHVGKKPSPESLKKRSLSMKGNKNAAGKVCSPEHRAKLSAANRGKQRSSEHCANLSIALRRYYENKANQKAN